MCVAVVLKAVRQLKPGQAAFTSTLAFENKTTRELSSARFDSQNTAKESKESQRNN